MRADRVHTLFDTVDCPMGGPIVRHDRGSGSRRRERHDRLDRKARKRDREAQEARELEEELLLTPEERAIRHARRVAEEKTKLASELMPVLIGAAVLVAFGMWPFALLVIFLGGRKSLRRAYRLFLEPRIRQRFIEQEVEKQVHATLSQERRELEGEHARSMEQLSASIAHEIRNPITAAKSLVQQMEEDPTRRENVEYARGGPGASSNAWSVRSRTCCASPGTRTYADSRIGAPGERRSTRPSRPSATGFDARRRQSASTTRYGETDRRHARRRREAAARA